VAGENKLGTNYGRDLFKQLQETVNQVEKLTAEILEMKPAHQMEITSLKTGIERRKKNAALKAENQKLKAIINKDGSNSSKPPSSDGFKKLCDICAKMG
jgi:DNA-directed RNA polymerase subunit F